MEIYRYDIYTEGFDRLVYFDGVKTSCIEGYSKDYQRLRTYLTYHAVFSSPLFF